MSQFEFSALPQLNDQVNFTGRMNVIKSVAVVLKEALLNFDFKLDEHPCKSSKTLDVFSDYVFWTDEPKASKFDTRWL